MKIKWNVSLSKQWYNEKFPLKIEQICNRQKWVNFCKNMLLIYTEKKMFLFWNTYKWHSSLLMNEINFAYCKNATMRKLQMQANLRQ